MTVPSPRGPKTVILAGTRGGAGGCAWTCPSADTRSALADNRQMTILPLVVFQVLAAADFVNPGLVGLIPLHRLAQSFLEGDRWPPAQLTFDLAAIDGVAAVV